MIIMAARSNKRACNGESWVSKMRHAPWGRAGALSLTVLAHLALLLFVGKHQGVKTTPQPAHATLMVSLLPAPTPAVAFVEPASAMQPDEPLAEAPSPVPEQPVAPEPVPEPVPEPPRFFQLPELTSPPSVAHGLVRGDMLVLPGARGGYLSVRFWINELGEVVRAQLDTVDGKRDDEEQLLAALRQVHFLPARIGHLAVSSEMVIEVQVAQDSGF